MKFYYENNKCYIGDLLVPVGNIKVEFSNSDTEVVIYDAYYVNDRVNHYSGLITGLTSKTGVAYANRAALETVLIDFFG